MDRGDDERGAAHNALLIRGVKNNAPEALPDARLSANKKRDILRHWGMERPHGQLLDDIGLVEIPKPAKAHMDIAARKLIAALHYRHTGTALSDTDGILISWSQQGLPGVEDARKNLADGLPEFVVGIRVNTNIGDQFGYSWGTNPDEGLFGITAQFGSGLFLIAASAPWKIVEKLGHWDRFIPGEEAQIHPVQ